MFFKNHKRGFNHTFIYVNERKDKLKDIKEKAMYEMSVKDREYDPNGIRGFLTGKKHKKYISTSASIILLVTFLVLWYYLTH